MNRALIIARCATLSTTNKRKGFTLIELLIVAIVLSLLAAIVVPSFRGATSETELAALDADLASLRKAIELYYYQHGHWPGGVKSQGTCGAGTNTDTATPGAAAFVAHLTQYTTKSGIACSQPDSSSRYGPYLREIPTNPITNLDSVTAIQTGSLTMVGSGTDSDGGWLYDFVAGRILADQPSYSDR